jgi:uncharacterized protein (TIGR00375 family)
MATSREMSPEGLWRWAQIKGITVIGTGDFTHPLWLDELRHKLWPDGNGLLMLRKKFQPDGIPESCRHDVRFMLSAEISSIYKKNGRTRKVHCLVLVSSFQEAEGINKKLSKIGSLRSDGRPILKLDAKRLLDMALDVSPRAMLIPAHVWTPHFSVFGSASGFDSLEECFEELAHHVHSIETGLSSDPPMNWRIGGLDKITLVSNSDAHSPSNIGREANIFDTGVSYPHIEEAIRTREGFSGTIEFYPEAGKYHYDGHRRCGVSFSPEETIEHKGICPVCGGKLTVGVLHRVEKLADRQEGSRPLNSAGFNYIIPLRELIASVFDKGKNALSVEKEYFRLIENLGNELGILMDMPVRELEKAASRKIVDAIEAMRSGKVSRKPGFDGQYGEVCLSGSMDAQERLLAE